MGVVKKMCGTTRLKPGAIRCSLFNAYEPLVCRGQLRHKARVHRPQTKTGFRTLRGETCFNVSGRYWARTNDLHDVNVAL